MKLISSIKHTRAINLERGQALPVGIALIAMSCLVGITLFNTGAVVSEKMKLTNAADAAAYSGLLWQARALNFQAYTNRAMVANQVSIAQAVTLQSWARYGVIASENVNSVLGGIPYVGVVTNVMEQTFSATAQVMEPLAESMLAVLDQFNGVLSESQEAMYLASYVATPDIVEKVVSLNDASYRADSAFSLQAAGQNLGDWKNFTQSYDKKTPMAMDVRANLINESRDRFTRRRDWEFFENFWFYTSPLTKHKIYRRGDTRLISSGEQGNEGGTERWEWKAKDTVSLQNKVRTWRGTRRKEVPIGWAQAFANNERGSSRSLEACNGPSDSWGNNTCPRWLSYNRRAERLSDTGMVAQRSGQESQIKMNNAYNGIRAFRDLSNLPNQAKDPKIRLRVEIYKPAANESFNNAMKLQAPFESQQLFAKNEIAALSSAEVYYRRPELYADNGRVEYANGYNPFWDVRLSALSEMELNLARVIRAPELLAGSVSPSTTNTSQSSVDTTGVEQIKKPTDGQYALQAYPESTADWMSVASSSTIQLQASTEYLENQLQTTVRHSVATLLKGAVSGAFTGALGSISSTLDDIQSLYDDANDAVNGLGSVATDTVADLQVEQREAQLLSASARAEFERIEADILLQFEAALIEVKQEIEFDSSIVLKEIAALETLIDGAKVPDELALFQLQLSALNDKLEAVGGSTLDRQAEKLVAIVNAATVLINLDLETAKKIILLSTNNGDSINPLAGFTVEDDGDSLSGESLDES